MKYARWLIVVGLFAAAAFAALGGTILAQGNGPGLVVFASDRTGNFEIYTLDAQTGLMGQLTNNAASDIEPAWSPDGAFIAFVSDRDGDYELFVMRSDGTDVQQLTANNAEDRMPHWQPDGNFLIYTSDVNGQWDLYAISADGALVRQLTNDAADERGPGWGGEDGPAGAVVPPPTPFPTVAQATATPSLPDGQVTTFSLNVRANPGEGAQVLTQLQRNDTVRIVGRYYDNSWVQIALSDGRLGWVYGPLLNINIQLSTVPVVNAPYVAPPPTATPTPAQPTPVPVVVEFWVDKGTINSGECVKVSWNTAGIDRVYYKGEGVVGWGERQECPAATTTYHLQVILKSGVEDNRYITVVVN